MHICHSFFFTSMDFRENGHSIKTEALRWKCSVCRWPQRLASPNYDQFWGFTTSVKNKKCAKSGSKMVKNTVKRAQKAGFWLNSAKFVSHQLWVVGAGLGSACDSPKGTNLHFGMGRRSVASKPTLHNVNNRPLGGPNWAKNHHKWTKSGFWNKV